ncbi:non-ribosomal peptide synthetase, partial [Legionella pneumophila]|uniref:non-ribosomal peptide synthetase n=1 Tax=Legionella pneumophila TaxID=446 RepID=UPI00191C3D14
MAVGNYPTTNPTPAASANNLAYVIYTSGSTGQPKGVLSIHQGCVNRLLWMQNYCNMSSSDRILQKTPYTFDVSVWEFFLPLIGGAEIVFAKPDGHKDPLYLAEVIKQYEITILHFVPSMLQGFLDSLESCECPTVHSVITSGEALTASLVSQFKQKLSKTKLYNLYGPTEASIDVTYYDCSEKTTVLVPIGKPIWNIKLYILDSHLQPVPIGVIGELYLGGEGLARGYLNRPELTAERFIANPFVREEDKARGRNLRLYRTGDLCRYLEDVNIEYIGRIDNQVKIRGFRIELGEIATALLSHTAVKEAVVVAQEVEEGTKRLVGYYVLTPEAADGVSASDVRDYLKGRLPEYMVPSFLVTMEAMPLTPNGKLDRKALPAPEGAAIQKAYMAPRNALEEALVL